MAIFHATNANIGQDIAQIGTVIADTNNNGRILICLKSFFLRVSLSDNVF